MSEDMFGTFLGTNQLTNQPKRFLRKISGRYVPRVFLLFLQNILQKVREIVLDRKILSDLLRDMLERMFWVILVSCQICVWHILGVLSQKMFLQIHQGDTSQKLRGPFLRHSFHFCFMVLLSFSFLCFIFLKSC